MAANNAVQIGGFNANDKLGNDLHNAAKQGNRKRLKKILTTGLIVTSVIFAIDNCVIHCKNLNVAKCYNKLK